MAEQCHPRGDFGFSNPNKQFQGGGDFHYPDQSKQHYVQPPAQSFIMGDSYQGDDSFSEYKQFLKWKKHISSSTSRESSINSSFTGQQNMTQLSDSAMSLPVTSTPKSSTGKKGTSMMFPVLPPHLRIHLRIHPLLHPNLMTAIVKGGRRNTKKEPQEEK